MSVAITRVLGTALAGKENTSLDVSQLRDLTAVIEPIRIGDEGLSARLFSPLGYHVETSPTTGAAGTHSCYERLTISAKTTLRELLTHLYVLIPVLDDAKHYWVSDDELEKLFRFGDTWLATHPERELISRRYLRRAPGLARAAVAKLATLDAESSGLSDNSLDAEEAVERPLRLQERRIAAVIDVLRSLDAKSIVDLGCGNGDLLAALAREAQFERIGGSDVSSRELERAKARLDRQPMPISRREQIMLFASSLVYADRRLREYEVAALLEVIEHIDQPRLHALEQALFASARPRVVIITTPNREYNSLFANLPAGAFRHPDHRFEWTRSEFNTWASSVAEYHGYRVAFSPIGDADPSLGAPTQMAVFRCN
jgi:3' terminal RNA ribose 2'-O-methyltransferase Hen1